MPSLQDVYVNVKPQLDDAHLSRELRKVDGAKHGKRVGDDFARGMSGAFKGIAAGLAGAFAAVGVSGAIRDSIKATSDLGESVNAVNVVFGDAAQGVFALSDNAAKAVGLSKTQFNGLAVQFSSFATKVTGEGGDVAGTLRDLTGRAADFASVMNLEVGDAAAIFQSALAGETEPIKKFGIDLSAAAVEAYAYANGITVAGEELTETEKVQARYGLLMAETAKTQGDFANTSDSLANAQRIAKAGFADLQTIVGTAFLPTMSSLVGKFNEYLPALTEFATDKAPKVAAWLDKMTTGAVGLYDIIANGDYTAALREAFGWEEDSAAVDRILDIRDAAVGLYDLVVGGDFTGKLRSAFGWEEDSTAVAVILSIRDAVGQAYEKVKEFVGAAASGDNAELKEMFASLYDSAVKLTPVVQEFIDQLPSLADVTGLAVDALAFLADHADLLIKLMPFIVAGFVLWRTAQLASIALTIANLPIRAAEIAAMALQGRGNAALAFQLSVLTGVQQRSTAATIASTVATRAKAVVTGIASTATAIYTGITQRATIMAQLSALATYGQSTAFGTLTLAQKVAVVWQKAITAGQWLWNAAMSANPIGLVVAALAALVAGLVYAYKNSETFRNIVDGAWKAIREAVKTAWEDYIKPALLWLADAMVTSWRKFQEFQAIVAAVWEVVKDKVREGVLAVVNWFLDMAENVLDAADSAFGWIPGLGDKLDDAQAAFRTFRDGVNEALGGINDRDVKVTADATLKAFTTGVRQELATGGRVVGAGTGTSDSIPALLSNGEHVWTAREVASAGGHAAVEAMRAGVLRRAKGGRVEVVAQTSGLPQFEAAAKAFDSQFGKSVAQSLTGVVLDGAGSAVPGIGAGSQANLIAFGRMLQARGLRVSEHPSFGGVEGVHTKGSRHYSGRAIDVNAAAGTSVYEQRILDQIAPLAAAYGLRTIWRQPGHFNHAHFDYDQGGWLPPGTNTVHNGTGRPERVLAPHDEITLAEASVRRLAEVMAELVRLPNQQTTMTIRAGVRG